LVVGEVAQLGESLLAQLRLLDARNSKVLAQTRRRFRRGGMDDLLDALPAMIGELLQASASGGAASASPPARAQAPAEPAEAGKKAQAAGSGGAATATAAVSVPRPLPSIVRETGTNTWEFELAVPFASSGVMPVSLEVGPFTISELRVRNMPSEEETHDPSRTKDNSHPKPTVTARSHTTWDAQFKLKVTLEDDQGKVLLSCSAKKGLSRGEQEELNVCWIASIRTLDFPKVKVFHVTGRVKKD
jgi:hypothetical protein